MNAARYFRRYFSSNRLKNIYSDKIKYRATVGMDRITPAAFENKLGENVRLISQKVLSGKYKFTRYREVLISKGRGKEQMDKATMRWKQIEKFLETHPYIMNADVRALCGVSAATANRILAGLSTEGKLIQCRKNGHWAYRLEP